MSRTVVRLLAEYLALRDKLRDDRVSSTRHRNIERQMETLQRRLLVNYSPLVKHVAGRISARATAPLDQEDLISWGLHGLLQAIETYDPGRGTKFETYATSKIQWSIFDELRKSDPLPRRMRARAKAVERTREALGQRLSRSPTEKEVAQELGVDITEHRAFLELYSRAQVNSLELHLAADISLSTSTDQFVEATLATDPATEVEAAEVRVRLSKAIEVLGERERLVITFYFHEGLTLREIGRALGLTEGRISQILKSALSKLSEFLTGTWVDPGEFPGCSSS